MYGLQRLSLGDNWLVYDGETAVNPRFSVRKQVNILNTKCLAHVSSGSNCKNVNDEGSGSRVSSSSSSNKNGLYQIEGSYTLVSSKIAPSFWVNFWFTLAGTLYYFYNFSVFFQFCGFIWLELGRKRQVALLGFLLALRFGFV